MPLFNSQVSNQILFVLWGCLNFCADASAMSLQPVQLMNHPNNTLVTESLLDDHLEYFLGVPREELKISLYSIQKETEI